MMAVCTANPLTNVPEALRQAIALPKMRAGEESAKALTRLPTSKMTKMPLEFCLNNVKSYTGKSSQGSSRIKVLSVSECRGPAPGGIRYKSQS